MSAKTPATKPPASENPEASETKTPPAPSPKDLNYAKPKLGLLTKIFSRGFSGSNPFVNDGEILLKNGNPQHALKAFQVAIENDPACVAAYIGLAKCYSELGGIQNTKKAVQAYYKALEFDFLRIEIYEAVVMLYLKLGDNKNAHAEKKKLQTVRTLKNNPNNPVANNNLGIIQLHQKQYDAAIQSFQKAAKSEGVHSVAQLNLAKTWLQKGLGEKDEEMHKKLLIKAANELESYLNNNLQADGLLVKAKIFMAYGDYKSALSFCNEAYKLNNTIKEIYNTKRAIEEKLGNIREASEAFDAYQSLAKEERKMKP